MLQGPVAVTCLSEGRWSAYPPECIGGNLKSVIFRRFSKTSSFVELNKLWTQMS